jgi:hypothetical protein
MRKMILIIAASLIGGGLGGCASSDDAPASCHGAPRAANLYGSVLRDGSPSASALGDPSALDPAAPSSDAGLGPDSADQPRLCGRAPS